MIGYLLQFIAMASFGFSNCLWSKPLKRVPILLLIAIRAGITSLIFFIVFLLQSFFRFDFMSEFYKPLSSLNFHSIIISIGICAISYFGLFFFTKAIKTGSISLSIPILCLGTMISVLIGIFFYKETFSVAKITAALFFILGLWCMEKLNKQMWKLNFSKAIAFSLLSMLFWSACSLYPIGIKAIGTINFSFILEVTVCAMSFLGYIIQNKSEKLAIKKILKSDFNSIFQLSLFGFCGVFFSNLAFLYLPVSILGLLAIIQPVVSMCFAAYLLKERLLQIQYVGVVLILIGIFFSGH